MKIMNVLNYEELSIQAAEIIAAQVRSKPDSVLGLATGSTPLGCYQQLIRLHQEQALDFSRVTSFNLDEYFGLSPDSPDSYRYYMDHNFFNHINIDKSATHVPNGVPLDIEAECRQYDQQALEHGGTDLQILGIGEEGHIAFNEADTHFHPETRLVNLSQSTIEVNSQYFENKSFMPKQAVSVGMQFILNSRLILLLANSERKANALERTINGPVDPMVPASILQLHHNVIIIADKGALSKL